MVSSVISLSARTAGKVALAPSVDVKRAPVFTREMSEMPAKIDAKVSRASGDQNEPRRPGAGFLRSLAVKTEGKDGMPGVLGDIASQTWNSGREFAGASARLAARHVPTRHQMEVGACVALSATAGALHGGLASRGLNSLSNFSLHSEYPYLNHALIGAGAGIGAGLWWLDLTLPVAPAVIPPAAQNVPPLGVPPGAMPPPPYAVIGA